MRCSFGMNARQNADVPKLIEHYQKLGGVHAHLTQCYPGDVASQLRPYYDVADYVIWRQHGDEKLYQQNPETLANTLINTLKDAGINPNRTILHGHNEAGIGQTVLNWERAFAEKVLELEGRVVLLNLNPGTPEPEQIVPVEYLLKFMSDNRDRVKLGLHEYFPVQWDRGKGYLVGRFQNWNNFLRSLSKSTIQPAIFITEFGSDMVDAQWQKNLPKTSPYNEVRGYKSLANAYHWLLDLPLDEAYWLQWQQAFEQIYYGSNVEAILGYNWNAKDHKFGAPREDEMDMQDASTFLSLWVKWWENWIMMNQPSTTDIRPAQDDPKWSEEKIAQPKDKWTNLRKTQTAVSDANILTKVFPGDIVQTIDHPLYGNWIAVKLHNSQILEDRRIGFCHKDYISFRPRNADAEPPVEPPAPDIPAWETYFDNTEIKMINYALQYGEDFPEVGSHYKKLIKKFVTVFDGLTAN